MEHNVNLEVNTDKVETLSKKVKDHFKENQKLYAVGAGCLFVGLVLGRTAPRITVSPTFNNVAAPVFNNTVNNGGHCVKILKRLSDEKIFGEAGHAAHDIATRHGITYDRARWLLSRHINGYLPDVYGEIYDTIGVGTTG